MGIPDDTADSASSLHTRLTPQCVHVWQISLEPEQRRLDQCWNLLDSDERARARRFYFRRHRDAFVMGRGQLRIRLGRYLDTDPAEVIFRYNPHGKPSIQKPETDLRFNFTHSAGWALLAVSAGRSLGIDIEQQRQDVEIHSISRRFFTERETEHLLSYGGDEQYRCFFRYWTRKEAVLKAIGRGLTLSLGSFEVHPLDQGDSSIHWTGRPSDPRTWRLQDLEAPTGYQAALAAEGDDWVVQVSRK